MFKSWERVVILLLCLILVSVLGLEGYSFYGRVQRLEAAVTIHDQRIGNILQVMELAGLIRVSGGPQVIQPQPVPDIPPGKVKPGAKPPEANESKDKK